MVNLRKNLCEHLAYQCFCLYVTPFKMLSAWYLTCRVIERAGDKARDRAREKARDKARDKGYEPLLISRLLRRNTIVRLVRLL